MATKNKVKYGLQDVHYALATFDEDTGDVTYDTPVRIRGAVSLSLDAEGETNNWPADNGTYIVLRANNGYSGDLTIALIPESFYTDILHEEVDSNGVLAEIEDVEVAHFALLFRVEGDVHKSLHVFYNCTCSRPSLETQTKEDSIEPQTDTLSLTAYPLENGYVKARTGDSTPDSVYESWFDAVYIPPVDSSSSDTDSSTEDEDENASG